MKKFTCRKRSKSRLLPATKHDLEKAKEEIMSQIQDLGAAQLAQLATISTQLDAIGSGGVSNAADVTAVTAVGVALTDVAAKVAALVPTPVPTP